MEELEEAGSVLGRKTYEGFADMALRLVQRIHGDETAQAIQLGIEYDPEPPFDAGAPEKVPRPIADAVETVFRSREAEILRAATGDR